jgi:threonine aldolase
VARDRAAFLDALETRGVLMVPYSHGAIRAVTHYGITADDIDTTLATVRAALAETAGGAGAPLARTGA